MNYKLLCCMLLAGMEIQAQDCVLPPPPGQEHIFALDYDNDGHAAFDFYYFVNDYLRPSNELYYGVDSGGYDYIFYDSIGNVMNPPPSAYVNISADESRGVVSVYSGSGPTFDPVPPCFWPVDMLTSVRMFPLPWNGDYDNDNILNIDEDTNDNGNLMDDDDDNDGLFNVLDVTNSLSVPETGRISLKIVNPSSNGWLTFESDIAIISVTVYDHLGREIFTIQPEGDRIGIEGLASGIYLIKFQSQELSDARKIIIQ